MLFIWRWALVAPLLLLAMCVVILLPAPPAYAADCATEEAINVANYNTDTGSFTQNYGTTNQILMWNRDLAPGCERDLMTGSTAKVRLGGIYCNLVEIGWAKGYRLVSGTKYRLFTEWQSNCTTFVAVNLYSHPCIGIGDYQYYRAANDLGTTDWKLFYNCGSGWVQQDRFNGTGHAKGMPIGETFRFGGQGTGMYSEFRDLQRKFSDGTWNAWQWPKCSDDDASNWESVANWYNHFNILNGSTNC